MKQIELTVLSRDMDAVIEFLGRRALMHLSAENRGSEQGRGLDEAASLHIRENLERLASAAVWLRTPLPDEPWETSHFPGEAEEVLTDTITQAVSSLIGRENERREEKQKVEEALNEAKAFANLNAPFSDLDQLSYLTLRVGRLDPRRQEELRQSLSGRAVIIPLGSGDGGSGGRVLAAASRKGRFALDSELKKMDFAPISIPEGFKGIPSELLSGLEDKLKGADRELEDINSRREKLREEYGASLRSLTASYLMAGIAEQLKARVASTKNVYLLSGWVPADSVQLLVDELEKLTEGRIAVRSYSPEEIDRVREGSEKVPVSLEHGAFVKGFERVVFSYGAPLYGTIDPTPLVAVFFTVLFGIMFGDFGQGLVLLLLGILTGKRGAARLSNFRKFSVPLVAVGISSMVMGMLNGSVFTNEALLVIPTRAVTAFLTGRPMDRILTLMPLPEKGGSVIKLFYFFGFTIGVGALLNSAGLIVNTANQFFLRKYEKAFFARTGLSGILLFWYAIFLAVRFAASMAKPAAYMFVFRWYDMAGLVVPLLGIFLGPAIWRLVSGERPVFAEGVMVYVMEGFVEILETVSTYVSNTVSFLRVGAFALSHAVLSYIVFRFSEEVAAVPAGTAFSFIILVFGNVVIILLEGLIVAIQVVRLQYYEFFSKFFTETGVEFSPFRFRKEARAD
jgi:V/A-type H+-transporting ATPase subunit I